MSSSSRSPDRQSDVVAVTETLDRLVDRRALSLSPRTVVRSPKPSSVPDDCGDRRLDASSVTHRDHGDEHVVQGGPRTGRTLRDQVIDDKIQERSPTRSSGTSIGADLSRCRNAGAAGMSGIGPNISADARVRRLGDQFPERFSARSSARDRTLPLGRPSGSASFVNRRAVISTIPIRPRRHHAPRRGSRCLPSSRFNLLKSRIHMHTIPCVGDQPSKPEHDRVRHSLEDWGDAERDAEKERPGSQPGRWPGSALTPLARTSTRLRTCNARCRATTVRASMDRISYRTLSRPGSVPH